MSEFLNPNSRGCLRNRRMELMPLLFYAATIATGCGSVGPLFTQEDGGRDADDAGCDGTDCGWLEERDADRDGGAVNDPLVFDGERTACTCPPEFDVDEEGRCSIDTCEGWTFCGLGYPFGGHELLDIWSFDEDDVWIGSWEALLHWDGTSWSRFAFDFGIERFWGSAPHDLWALNCEGIGHWDGSSWSVVFEYVTDLYFCGNDIWGSASDDIWLSGSPSDGNEGDNTLYHWSGSTWSTVSQSTPSYYGSALWSSGPDDLWVTAPGTFYHWDGELWSSHDMPIECFVRDIWGASTDEIWAVGDCGALRWDGSEWSVSFVRHDLNAIRGTGPDNIWAVGEATIVHWDGVEWTTDDCPVDEDLNSLWVFSPDHVWVVGERGTLLQRSSSSWHIIGDPRLSNWWAAWPTSTDEILVVGENAVQLEDDQWLPFDRWKSEVWSTLELQGIATVIDVWLSSMDDVWVLASEDALHWDGSGWTIHPLGDKFIHLHALFATGPDDVWVLAKHEANCCSAPDDFFFFHWDGNEWSEEGFGEDESDELGPLWGRASDDLWILRNGRLLYFDGAEWTDVGAFRNGPFVDAWMDPSGRAWLIGDERIVSWDGVEATTSCDLSLSRGERFIDITGTDDGAVVAVTNQGVYVREAHVPP